MNRIGGEYNIATRINGGVAWDRCSVTVSLADRELIELLARGEDPPAVVEQARKALVRMSNDGLVDHYRLESSATDRIRPLVIAAIRAQSPNVDVVPELIAGRDIVEILGRAVGRADVELFQAIADGDVNVAPAKRRINTAKQVSVKRCKPSPYQALSRGLLPQAGARRKARSTAVSKVEARKARRLRDQAANDNYRAPNGLCQAGG
ncbi:MAG: hypothetical protein HOA84_04105, partial [Candidatus Jacksonbacteria bacterium]|nr:hypothetical protein [Candidatus Jacksonbacteria bacterium]